MERYRCLSGNVLKWIGIITMLIDHIGAVLIYKIFLSTMNPAWLKLYWPFRYIGRIAFPIFCFTLVEGFVHTRSRGKYLGRLFLFALISEIPFDLAVEGVWFTWNGANVMFTFTLGLALLWMIQWLLERMKGAGTGIKRFLYALLVIADIVIIMGFAEYLNTDYGAVGILAIVLFYLNRERRLCAAIFGCGAILLLGRVELPGLLAILPILLYNGTRGRQGKYFFYLFYPGHLLLLGLLARYVLV